MVLKLDDNGIKHPIKGKEIVHSIPNSGEEYDMAIWIENTFGGSVHLIPRITDITNTGIKTHTPDFRWNGKKWELKTPGNSGKFENSIERFLKKKEAKRFIIDFKNFSDKTDEEIIELAEKTLNNPYRQWIEELILVRGSEIIKVYSKQ